MTPHTVAVTRTKNEADIIEHTVRRIVRQVDHVIVGDDSTDGTPQILERLIAEGLPITLLHDQEPTFRQPEQMNAHAQRALEMGAEWVVPFDGDEVWFADGRIADYLASLPGRALIVDAPLFNHKATILDNVGEPDPVKRIGWRCAEPVPLRKVACRLRENLRIHFGQHGADYIGVRHPLRVTGGVEIRHYPYRTLEQLVRKITVGGPPLAASDVPKNIGAHWRGLYESYQRAGEPALRDWFERWGYSADPEADPELVFNPCPM